MSNKSGVADNIINLPQGGGAQKGMGEKFSADLFTGTGNFSVPIAVPPGRNGFQPNLTLGYSSGNGNGPFGLGWNLSVPGVVRKTNKGIPRYDDELDVFILSGSEDLIQIKKEVASANGATTTKRQYRPRTEGLFARITHVHVSNGLSYWEVKSKDGLVSFYGSDSHTSNDLSKLHDPEDASKVFAWKLTKTVDPFGNTIQYNYSKDLNNQDGSHYWDQNYLKDVQYMDYDDGTTTRFLCKVEFNYEDRPDPMSDYSGGFEVRTVQRCTTIVAYSYPGLTETKIKTHQLNYLDKLVQTDPSLSEELPINGASILKNVQLIGHDGAQTESMPPLEFKYGKFQPEHRDFKPIEGPDLPWGSLANPQFELADVQGNGLPDIIQLDERPRYWRNLGNGHFARPKSFKNAPLGLTLSDQNVQLVDAQGDGRADILVNKGAINGYFPMRFDGEWDQKAFVKNEYAPSFSYSDPEVKMMDMTGDGITDVVRNGSRLELFYFDEAAGFHKTATINKATIDRFPNVSFGDPRIQTASITGGLQDIVRVENGSITYWPNMGYGKFGAAITMKNSPRFDFGFDPKRLLLGDLDGDGYADLAYVENNKVLLYVNQSGNAWSDPIEIIGTPSITDLDAVRLVDILGQGTPCILWTRDASVSRQNQYLYLDLTGGVKPYVLNEMNNNMGAITRTAYRPSTHFYLLDELGYSVDDLQENDAAFQALSKGELPPGKSQAKREQSRWQTPLPFPTQCLAKTEVIDQISNGKLVTQYHYHNGYWDGGEREFRGFAHVDQVNTETFETYNKATLGSERTHNQVSQAHYASPTMVKNWFHVGPVGDAFGDWKELDLSHEFWSGDTNILQRSTAMTAMIEALPRRAKRDAYRTLRGSAIRTELYALDGSTRQDRPYTVTESLQGVRLEFSPEKNTAQGPGLLASDPLTALGNIRSSEQAYNTLKHSGHIFFVLGVGTRTTQWERGAEPMHSFSFSDGYDSYGQVRKQVSLAVPRGKNPCTAASTGEPFLATYSNTSFIHKDTALVFMCDRSSEGKSWEVENNGSGTVFDLRDSTFQGTASLKVQSHVMNFYDGAAFEGLSLGNIGNYGMVSKIKRLAMTSANIIDAFGSVPNYLQTVPSWGGEYPTFVKNEVPDLLGFELETSAPFEPGYYILQERNKYDFQEISFPNLGLVLQQKDAMGVLASLSYDSYSLMPVEVRDSGNHLTTAEYDYRTFQVKKTTDHNENVTTFAFSPFGLLYKTAMMGTPGQNEGDDLDHPTIWHEYDFHAFIKTSSPIWVKTIKKEAHYYPSNVLSDTITSVDFSDGLGRLLQNRTQAENVIYGTALFGDSGLPKDQAGPNQNAVGIESAAGENNVIVSGWQVYDNKGQVVEAYEPFYDKGFEYKDPETLAGYLDSPTGAQKARSFYNPLGQVVRSINPDGTEQRVILGVPSLLDLPPDPSDPAHGGFSPTPWERYIYDANDLAPITHPTGSGVPTTHHYTPKSEVLDALGRVAKNTEHQVQDTGSTSFEDVVMSYAYDLQGRITQVRDAFGRLTFDYIHPTSNLTLKSDGAPTPLVTTHIDSGKTTLVYNALGQMVEMRDAKKSVSIALYDYMNRQHYVYSRNSKNQEIIRTEHFEYGNNSSTARTLNKAGRLKRIYNQSGIESLDQYDFKGNLTHKIQSFIKDEVLLNVFDGPPINWSVPTYRVDWENGLSGHTGMEFQQNFFFDALNRLTQQKTPEDVSTSSRKDIYYHYNKAGALTRVGLDAVEYVSEIAYNAKGQRTLIAYGNAQMTRYSYDSQNFRLVRQKTERYVKTIVGDTHTYIPQSGTTRQDTGYEYDLFGNILKVLERTSDCGIAGSILGKNALDRHFSYDPLNRLISATGREMESYSGSDLWFVPNHPSPGSPNADHTQAYTRTYTYDKLGNVEQLQSLGINSFTRTFNYQTTGSIKDHNQQDSIAVGMASHNFTYDEQGNMLTTEGNRHYVWNYRGQLQAFYIQNGSTEPSIYAQYLYDHAGNRVKKIVRNAGGSYESNAYIDAVFEYRTDGTRQQNTVYCNDGGARIVTLISGDVFPDDLTETSWYVISDHLGSGSLRLNLTAGGSIIDREEYYPFGDSSLRTTGRKRYRYIGKEKDSESGLNYHGARYFSAWTCRFLSTDPWASKYPWQSPYAYFKNRPVSQIDWNGYGDNDDKFYDVNGNLVHDDGQGDDVYIVSQEGIDNLDCSNDCLEQSEILKQHAIKTYKTEEAAAKAWAPEGYSATRVDNLERAAAIYSGTMKDGTTLFVLGNTVEGKKSSNGRVTDTVNPFASNVELDGRDLLEAKNYKFNYVRNYKYDEESFETPLAVKWGWMENPITFEGWVTIPKNVWSISGVTHTHPKNGRPVFSASPKEGGMDAYSQPIGGDIGMAIDGYNVYLVPTSSATLSKMYFISKKDLDGYWTDNTTKAEKQVDKRYKKQISLTEN